MTFKKYYNMVGIIGSSHIVFENKSFWPTSSEVNLKPKNGLHHRHSVEKQINLRTI